MDTPVESSNPLPNLPTQQTPTKQKSSVWKMIAVDTALLFVGVAVGAGGYFLYSSRTNPVTSYEACVKANGSQLTLMYPGTCTTKDGKTFTQPISDEEKKKLLPPTVVPTESIPVSSPSAYSCPPGEWVDCMPGPSSEGIRWECTPEFLSWAKAKCPGFKGAAL